MAGIKGLILSFLLIVSLGAKAQLNGASEPEGQFDPGVEDMENEPAMTPTELEPPASKPAPAPKAQPPTASRPSTPVGSGGVIFDWSKYQNANEVPHPYAEKGLLRITRDRTYIYKVDESDQKTAVQVRFGIYDPINLTAPGKDGAAETRFEDNYETQNPAVMADWEWQAWRSPIGKWGLTVGTGVYVAQGNGHYANGLNGPGGSLGNNYSPREIFTFVLLPVNIGAMYRLQIWHRQLLIPYATGGGTAYIFSEFRDDNKGPKFGAAPGAYFAAGGAFNLSYFDSMSRIQLDREYGINAIYLTGEYRQLISLNKKFDFDSDLINAGFLIEY